MKRCLRYHAWVLARHWWLSLLPPVLGLLLGWEAAAELSAYVRRSGMPEARSALALALEVRHFVPLAGAVWASAFLGIEFDGRAAAIPPMRGFRLARAFGCKLLLQLLGCAVISVCAQLTTATVLLPALRSLPPLFLLRCFGLRLLLDLGMTALPAAVAVLAGANLYGRALVFLYGLLLWRLQGAHYALWLPELGAPARWALWPLPALPLSAAAAAFSLRRKEL